MYICILFIIIAAFFNAVMDKTKDTIQFNSSVFKNKNPKFWDDQQSESSFIPGTKYKFNAWHIAKSLFLFFIIMSGYFLYPNLPHSLFKVTGQYDLLGYLLDFIFIEFVWVQSFNFFYNKVLKSKK